MVLKDKLVMKKVCMLLLWLFICNIGLVLAQGRRFEFELGILRRALAEGKALYFPRCLDDAGQMAFYRVQALEDLESGSFGVREPSLAAPQYNMDLDGQALCLVPGLCFDGKGYRRGNGKGDYDRDMAKHHGAT